MPVLRFYHRLDKKSVIEVSDSIVFAGVHKTRIRLFRAEISRQSDFAKSRLPVRWIALNGARHPCVEQSSRSEKHGALRWPTDAGRLHFRNSGSFQAVLLAES